MASSEDAKKNGIMKPIIIIIVTFLMVPLLTVGIIYYADENFRYKADETLSNYLPGKLGDVFAKKPTKEEKDLLKIQIAKKYATYEDHRLVDKLKIIKSKDESLFNEFMILLNRENPSKTARVQETLRLGELKSDIYQQLLTEINVEQEETVDSLIEYYSSLNTNGAIKEIERTFNSGELSIELLPLVFDKLPVEQSALFLEGLNQEIKDKVEARLIPSKKAEIEKVIESNRLRNQELASLAEVYKETPLEELVQKIGSADQYNISELAKLYQKLPIGLAGEVLARVEDQEFIGNLYKAITELENLNTETSGLSNHLAASALIQQEYEKKLQELAQVYEKLPIIELASLVNEMLQTERTYKRHQLPEGTEIIFTQEQLVVDVLRRLKPTLVAKLMEELETSKSVELSKKLVTK
ncbi:hypothetical protein [Alkaliphilus hydrothermalis]|uniref:ASC-1-like (ASCH) protein n=1 Tax=Alkaliphilus hydrothermalis TaxID=1482730 RepID=A0ABS2NM53_9FIRM|nr:hypothetical protein [Alkaliphilus hydrothermalis]MBM7613659.1 ASC-1-like (ASCH) protein [Alkaliphilus hydrothermalis]